MASTDCKKHKDGPNVPLVRMRVASDTLFDTQNLVEKDTAYTHRSIRNATVGEYDSREIAHPYQSFNSSQDFVIC